MEIFLQTMDSGSRKLFINSGFGGEESKDYIANGSVMVEIV